MKNGNDVLVRPALISNVLTKPPSANILFIINKLMKAGIAIVKMKSVRKTFLPLIPLALIIIAKITPKKNDVTVAATAQINVQASTGKKVLAICPEITLPKFAKPTQLNKFLGGK